MSPKRIIIVGASSGIGYELARLYIESGWEVGIAARRTEPLELLKQMSPAHVFISAIDVTTDLASVALQDLIDLMKGVDVYVHVAGIGYQNPDLEIEVELATIDTNAQGFTRLVDTAYQHMAQNGGGHIAIISSIAGTRGLGLAPAYSATKKFQNTYIEALAQLSSMQSHGICFTDIRPGFVDTPLLAGDYRYPMLLKAPQVARSIKKAISKRKRVKIIDWKYRILNFFWQLIPHGLWQKLSIGRLKGNAPSEQEDKPNA